jgi:hypothetical protein
MTDFHDHKFHRVDFAEAGQQLTMQWGNEETTCEGANAPDGDKIDSSNEPVASSTSCLWFFVPPGGHADSFTDEDIDEHGAEIFDPHSLDCEELSCDEALDDAFYGAAGLNQYSSQSSFPQHDYSASCDDSDEEDTSAMQKAISRFDDEDDDDDTESTSEEDEVEDTEEREEWWLASPSPGNSLKFMETVIDSVESTPADADIPFWFGNEDIFHVST